MVQSAATFSLSRVSLTGREMALEGAGAAALDSAIVEIVESGAGQRSSQGALARAIGCLRRTYMDAIGLGGMGQQWELTSLFL